MVFGMILLFPPHLVEKRDLGKPSPPHPSAFLSPHTNTPFHSDFLRSLPPIPRPRRRPRPLPRLRTNERRAEVKPTLYLPTSRTRETVPVGRKHGEF